MTENNSDDDVSQKTTSTYGMPRYTVEEEIGALASAGLLTERQAEAYVRRRVEAEPGYAVAETMGIAQSTVADYVADAEAKLEAAEATLEALERIRYQAPSEAALDDHPRPPDGSDRWVVGDHELHAPGPNGVSLCGYDGGRVVHYRQLTGARADHDLCGECWSEGGR